jgi:hypothetical protein
MPNDVLRLQRKKEGLNNSFEKAIARLTVLNDRLKWVHYAQSHVDKNTPAGRVLKAREQAQRKEWDEALLHLYDVGKAIEELEANA